MVALSELSKEGRPPRNNLTGERFERLVVREWVGRSPTGSYWRCECDCGNIVNASASNLRNNTKSCGCLSIEIHTKHGLSKSRAYRAWRDIKGRCFNPKHPKFPIYGGRGIGMFQGWQNDFKAFYDHVGEPTSQNHSIDRINNSRGYYPGNLRWATVDEQHSNRRVTVWVEFKGERVPLYKLAKEHNLSPSLLSSRVKRDGWDIEKALTAPIKNRQKNSKSSAQTTPSPLSA